jgi:hypothetical protein
MGWFTELVKGKGQRRTMETESDQCDESECIVQAQCLGHKPADIETQRAKEGGKDNQANV